MGQAFRRASSKLRTTSPPSSSSQLNKPLDRPPPFPTADSNFPASRNAAPSSDEILRKGGAENVVEEEEERDSEYDDMLSKMVGRIQTKPGGKLEMGGAFVVEKYNRPMPKLRNTTTETGGYEQRPAPPGTLNVAQLRHMILLYQGKADDHNGPMDVNQIAEKFRIDVAQVQRAVQFLCLQNISINRKKIRRNPITYS